MSLVRVAGLAALALTVALPVAAQGIPKVQSPEEVGFLATRLKRLSDRMNEGVKNGEIPGAVVLIARNGKLVMFESFGFRDKEAKAPMTNDTIFRIASMTKPIVTVAAMLLVEDGVISVADPVSRFLPAFADTKVAVPKKNADGTVEYTQEPQSRAMTVQDLMRHTSGLTYGFFGEGMVKKLYVDNNITTAPEMTNAEFAERIATMPLAYHPGSTWDYSNSTDVLGRIIEIVSGQTLYEHLKARLLDPLGMRDTSFYLPEPERQARLAEPMNDDRSIGVNAPVGNPRVVGKMESAGGGLVSTAPDYMRFLMMLRNGGQLDGRRYLSPRTLDFMLANHLDASVVRTPLYLPGAGYGFGLGVAVRTSTGESASASAVGEYTWGGAGGTYMWVDPASDLIVVFMMQSPRNRVPYRSVLRNMVYGAVTEARLPAGR
jgi:CubicO group peptidase (beta-lactamase class C family)